MKMNLFFAFTSLFAANIQSAVNEADKIAPDVYFHEGDIKGKGHCNNGWIIFEDYVLVIDANFPSGAEEIIPKIKAITDKPVRFAFDTHHHGDHAYGNQLWVDKGAVPVAHTGVVEEMKKYETGYYGGKPGRWEDTAKSRKDVANSKFKPPSLLFPKELFFDDNKHRVELVHFGVAHTHGDGFAWLPHEQILYTGDACVNGPYNYVADGSVTEWIKTLEAAKTLHPKIVCPGHGPRGDGTVLEDQQLFFKELLANAKKLKRSGKSAQKLKDSVDGIRDQMKKNTRIARYVGDGLPAQLEKAYVELGGKPFLAKEVQAKEQEKHMHDHGDEHDHDHSHESASTAHSNTLLSPRAALNAR
jgi:cyclase